ncbi:bifunctional metallophosphatase/5'-nucleotidase [Bacillus pinisoli]|uniref:bifunctional metallophosphatase/5'-nucleotidase n=1 Tax=Bacillus pinisoli TaxID=2901866 RepID=UPI001FF2695C|nr:bifunctional UDP-sugar hydrolase/5'-nucleotidase [Bacillus pinisoli]
MMEQIHIYHINDLHSHFENWPKIAGFVREKRKQHDQNQQDMLLLDVGDHMDRFHPITEATLGKANVRLMNELGYDYATIGNNEGITLSNEQLNELYEDATFSVLVANLFKQDGSYPDWVKPYSIYETKTGFKLAIIGVSVPFQKFYQLLGWDIKNPQDILPSLVNRVKQEGADFVMILSHLGINEDERMARELDGVDLILGGHTHHLFDEGLEHNGTMLGAAGKFGMNVGYVKLTVDPKTKVVQSIEPSVISMEGQLDCLETKARIERETELACIKLGQKITQIDSPLEVEWYKPSILPDLLADAIREWCEAEIGMINAGVLLESLPEGDVTFGDLHRICPHPINPCKVVLTGAELKEVILQAATPRMEHLKMKGFGFRGKVLGRMVYSGVIVETTILDDQLPHVHSILINNQPIDPDRNYIVATLDMFTFGNLYPEISHAKEKEYYLPEMLRDILQWKLLKNA